MRWSGTSHRCLTDGVRGNWRSCDCRWCSGILSSCIVVHWRLLVPVITTVAIKRLVSRPLTFLPLPVCIFLALINDTSTGTVSFTVVALWKAAAFLVRRPLGALLLVRRCPCVRRGAAQSRVNNNDPIASHSHITSVNALHLCTLVRTLGFWLLGFVSRTAPLPPSPISSTLSWIVASTRFAWNVPADTPVVFNKERVVLRACGCEHAGCCAAKTR